MLLLTLTLRKEFLMEVSSKMIFTGREGQKWYNAAMALKVENGQLVSRVKELEAGIRFWSWGLDGTGDLPSEDVDDLQRALTHLLSTPTKENKP